MLIPTTSIKYLTSKARRILLKTVSGERVYYGKLDEEEKKLDAPEFVRIHRSCIVNLDYASNISAKVVTIKDEPELTIARSYRDAVKKAYSIYRGSEL
jgi:DNA-binding LytR/AlgR family response regulator